MDGHLAAAVMVDDHHPPHAGEQFRRGDHVGDVGVHHHEEGMRRRHVRQKRLFSNEEVSIFRLILQEVGELINPVVHGT